MPVKVRVLGAEAVPPGADGLVRLHLARAAAPAARGPVRAPGERPVRDGRRWRGPRRGAGPPGVQGPARPSPSTGWWPSAGGSTCRRAGGLTGERRPPTSVAGSTAPGVVERLVDDLAARVAAAGPLGLDVARLDERERAVSASVAGRRGRGGRARPADVRRPPRPTTPSWPPWRRPAFTPPGPEGVDRAELRELVRRGLVVERDGVYFAPSAVDAAAQVAARLLAAKPEGFTVAELRDALGTTRKHGCPSPASSTPAASPAAAATSASPAPASRPERQPPRTDNSTGSVTPAHPGRAFRQIRSKVRWRCGASSPHVIAAGAGGASSWGRVRVQLVPSARRFGTLRRGRRRSRRSGLERGQLAGTTALRERPPSGRRRGLQVAGQLGHLGRW